MKISEIGEVGKLVKRTEMDAPRLGKLVQKIEMGDPKTGNLVKRIETGWSTSKKTDEEG